VTGVAGRELHWNVPPSDVTVPVLPPAAAVRPLPGRPSPCQWARAPESAGGRPRRPSRRGVRLTEGPHWPAGASPIFPGPVANLLLRSYPVKDLMLLLYFL
jgi:hypothetical protein